MAVALSLSSFTSPMQSLAECNESAIFERKSPDFAATTKMYDNLCHSDLISDKTGLHSDSAYLRIKCCSLQNDHIGNSTGCKSGELTFVGHGVVASSNVAARELCKETNVALSKETNLDSGLPLAEDSDMMIDFLKYFPFRSHASAEKSYTNSLLPDMNSKDLAELDDKTSVSKNRRVTEINDVSYKSKSSIILDQVNNDNIDNEQPLRDIRETLRPWDHFPFTSNMKWSLGRGPADDTTLRGLSENFEPTRVPSYNAQLSINDLSRSCQDTISCSSVNSHQVIGTSQANAPSTATQPPLEQKQGQIISPVTTSLTKPLIFSIDRVLSSSTTSERRLNVDNHNDLRTDKLNSVNNDKHKTSHYDKYDTVCYDQHDSVYYDKHDTVHYDKRDTVRNNKHDIVYYEKYDKRDSVHEKHDTVHYEKRDTIHYDEHASGHYDKHDTVYHDEHDTVLFDKHDTVHSRCSTALSSLCSNSPDLSPTNDKSMFSFTGIHRNMWSDTNSQQPIIPRTSAHRDRSM